MAGATDKAEIHGERRRVIRRAHERLTHLGRRMSDRRLAAADQRRVLLVGPDEAWRLMTAYAFEEVGYVAYAADDRWQALTFSARLLPDVIVIHMDSSDTLDLLETLADGPTTSDIPVAVLAESLGSSEARRALAAGTVTLVPHGGHVDDLVGDVDALIAVAPRAQRALKRRLLDLQELARHYTPDADGQAAVRRLIDRLQVAIFAVDEQGRCIAASQGATALTGYTRAQLLHASVFTPGFAGGRVSEDRWRVFLMDRHFAGTTTITNRTGDDITVHAAAVAEVMPGLHVAAFAAA
jgi:PAS domain S-box-containing protein